MQSFSGDSEHCQNNTSESGASDSNSENIEDSTEIPPRMEVNLPKCYVVLRRLTEEEINRSYPCDGPDEVSNDVKFKTEEILNKTVEAMTAGDSQQFTFRRKESKRPKRKPLKSNSAAFEQYKRNREAYKKRKKNVLHSESNSDMSQNELSFSEGSIKPKKKIKRLSTKYELDSEWNPSTSKAKLFRVDSSEESESFSDGATKPKKKAERLNTKYEQDSEWNPSSSKAEPFSPKALRYRPKKALVDESGSSSSDEDEQLYNMYMEHFNPETVSSEANAIAENNSSDKISHSDPEPQKIGDILSSILQDMNELRKNRIIHNTSEPQSISKPNNLKTKVVKNPGKRLSESSEINVEKVVASLLNNMVNKVSSKLRCPNNKTKNDMKPCKSCHNLFKLYRNSDSLCEICKGLKSGAECEIPSTSSRKPITSGKVGIPKQVIKGRNINSTMSKVLKNLPKTEMQRLIYAKKTDKLTVGKGYNHCKSFTTPKDNDASKNENKMNIGVPRNKLALKINEANKSSDSVRIDSSKSDKVSHEKKSKHHTKINTPKDNVTKNVEVHQSNSDGQEKKISVKTNKVPVNKNDQSVKTDNKNDKLSLETKSKNPVPNRNSVLLEKSKEGLFLMTYPDPDEELDLDLLIKPSTSQEETSSKNLSKQNTQQEVGNLALNTKSSKPSDPKKLSLPPVPTVIVSNYCGDTSTKNLSQIYLQNQITHEQAMQTSNVLTNPTICAAVTASSVVCQNSILTTNSLLSSNSLTTGSLLPSNSLTTGSLLPSNSLTTGSLLPSNSLTTSSLMPSNSLTTNSLLPGNSITVATLPIYTGFNQTQFLTLNPVPIVNSQPSIPVCSMPVFPIVSSVISLSDMNVVGKVKETVPMSFSPNNFVNSQQSGIKIDNVTSLNAFEKQNSVINTESSENMEVANPLSELESEKVSRLAPNNHIDNVVVKPKETEGLSAERTQSNSDKYSSECAKTSHIEGVASDQKVVNSNNDSAKTNMDSSKSAENVSARLSKSSNKTSVDKSADNSNKENFAPQTAIGAAIDMLDAISILAVIDLDKNPLCALNIRIQMKKNELDKLKKENMSVSEPNPVISSCQYNLQVLGIAKRYLNLYGSFNKVSDHFLRKAKMIQIKKELHEEETNQSSCMFSQSSQLNSLLSSSQSNLSRASEITSPLINQINHLDAFRTNDLTASPISHIEKLESHLACTLNNVNSGAGGSQYGALSSGGTVHQYTSEPIAALRSTVVTPTPMTPRNDFVMGDSRETPSRGSGSRTPARPESAASQSEQSLVQVKKEKFESQSATPPLSQCAYSQNTMSLVSSQLPVMSQVQNPNMLQQPVASTSVPFQVNNTSQAYTNQTRYNIHPNTIASNRMVSYSNNQNYSNTMFNVANQNQPRITPNTQNTNFRQNQQVRQQAYQFCSKQPVPSITSNQYVIRQLYSSSNTSGTATLNNTQGQNALLANVSDQQFYTSSPASQPYLPSVQQMSYTSNNILNTMPQDVAATIMQQAEIQSSEQMFCAVCNGRATLRCKQCARVAYCNTTCAKTYWHKKHKMECKPSRT